MDPLKSINEIIEKNKEEMLATLGELIKLKSVVAESKEDMPFGEDVHKAFSYMLKKGRDNGFKTKNVDNYGGHIDFPGEEGGVMGIVGHLDVVPEGTGWIHEPYGGEQIDGMIYGRGTMDDKGPVVASFYAMKAIKEAGIKLDKTVRLVLGLDEETNWIGMEHYLSKVEPPDFGFTPDGDFPAIHGEMGILVFEIAKKLAKSTDKGLELRTVRGGNAANMVPDNCRAVIRDENIKNYSIIKEKVAAFRNENKGKINCKGVGKSLEITTQGISSHGAKPESGVNAISIMMEFLGQLNFVNEDANDFVEFYNKHIGYNLHGESLGCGFEDQVSGKLILNVGVIDFKTEAVTLTVNIRYPITVEGEDVYQAIMPVMNKYNLGVVKEKHEESIYLPSDDPMIVTLMDIYRKHTGDQDSQPLVIGGGTYARAIKNTVAFGARFPGEPELGHQKNECISVENLMKMTKIYGEAIYRLAY
ncbi:MAG: dipeptidase PepV [Anaerovoracaceae bacterium]